jgi:serine/threonine protein kinase
MELGVYGSLFQVVKTIDPSTGDYVMFPPVVILTWIYQVANAICYLHKLNILHKDIKAENVLIMSEFHAKLADFGTAKQTDGKNTNTHSREGTFLAPEIFKGKGSSEKSDVFALGSTFLQCCLKSVEGFETKNINRAIEIQNFPSECGYAVKSLLLEMKDENPTERPTCKDVIQY